MNSPTRGQGAAAKWLLLLLVRFYQIFFSPFLGGACKFYPSCSHYAQEAIAMHGARRGAWLAMKRLGRCRPFTKGGFDPVPDVMEEQVTAGELVRTAGERVEGTSAAKAAVGIGEDNVVAKATTHKPTIQKDSLATRLTSNLGTSECRANSENAKGAATTCRAFEHGDADWLRTMGKERAQ
ncbi:MAG: membrane protein insertion efficiency factor YidD [Candidatus Acidiferrales bacterium]